jgi:hypothetical protein
MFIKIKQETAERLLKSLKYIFIKLCLHDILMY